MREFKMAELSVEAPLAMTEEWSDFSDFHTSDDIENSNQKELRHHETSNFNETFSASLEDLVNTFDDKITKCFCNYEEKVEKFAPVQVRTQEEIMNECQIWWTLTGNFGNMLPIDWSKSYARKLQINCLNLNEKMDAESPDEESNGSLDDDMARDLDLHSLVLTSLQHQEPLFTAEQVLQEIDEIMQEEAPVVEEVEPEPKETDNGISSILYEEKLRCLSTCQLGEVYGELERLIRQNSEVLIHELALRDELEYEKELKNTFISCLLRVQDRKRRHPASGAGRRTRNAHASSADAKFLTTVIPYSMENGPPDNPTLQILIKILKAIYEDNPAVPALLTDYILKVLCPT
ncbi:fasciculation and elongation protein zeta-2-like [Uloborus diversus]|uniref:fasciculation and elongation protein zeta-2-like n=1 Tax=Uloborus diversus TaxID=327109 RepID=UPI00240951A2|nr:fasciculation and elongation protein zeta-2-like [Uloborus diversus]